MPKKPARNRTTRSSTTRQGQQPTVDVTRLHVRRILEAQHRRDEARLERVEELERAGRRIVTGGQTMDGWEIIDWRTDDVIAKGTSGFGGYEAATHQHDPDGTFYHIDSLSPIDETPPYVETPGMPASLGRVLEDDWIGRMDTTDEEIAAFIGWPVEKVSAYRG